MERKGEKDITDNRKGAMFGSLLQFLIFRQAFVPEIISYKGSFMCYH